MFYIKHIHNKINILIAFQQNKKIKKIYFSKILVETYIMMNYKYVFLIFKFDGRFESGNLDFV